MADIFEEAALPERLGSIYKLWHSSDPNTFYVGSTKTSLAKRLRRHKNKVKSGNTQKIYNYLREKGIDGARIEHLEQVIFQTALQLRTAEDEWIRRLSPTLNSVNAIRDEENKKEYKRNAKNC